MNLLALTSLSVCVCVLTPLSLSRSLSPPPLSLSLSLSRSLSVGARPHEPAGARTCVHITVCDPRVTLPLSGRGSSGLCPLRSLFSFLFLFPSLSVCARIAWPASSSLPSREGTGERERERKMGNEREERERELFPSGGGGMVPEDLCVFQL
jgi:hypothetical protein